MTVARSAPRAWLAFAATAFAIWLGCRAVLASPGFARRPDVLALGVVLDLVVTLPALAWFLLVRPGHVSARTLAAFFAGGAALARAMLPAGHQTLIAPLAWVGAALEALLVGWLVWAALRIARGVRAAGRDVPFEEALEEAGRPVLGSGPFSWLVLTELSLLGFALAGWRWRPHRPPAAEHFTSHRTLALPAIFVAILMAGVAETLVVHLLAARWSVALAWALTALSAYSLVWLAGDFRAIALRPTLLTRDALEVRIGVRWRASIPRELISRVCPGPDARNHPDSLRATPFGMPNLYVHLSEPVTVRGPLGISRTTRCLGLRFDDPSSLKARLEEDRQAV